MVPVLGNITPGTIAQMLYCIRKAFSYHLAGLSPDETGLSSANTSVINGSVIHGVLSERQFR